MISLVLFAGGLTDPLLASTAQTRVSLKTIEPFAICSLPHKGPVSDLTQVTENLMNFMQAQNIGPAGDLVVIYPIRAGQEVAEQLDWEAGFPVGSHITVIREPLVKKEWKYTTVAAANHSGPLNNTNDTIDDIFEWIENRGYQQDGPVLAIYKTMPNQITTSTRVSLEIWVPCKQE